MPGAPGLEAVNIDPDASAEAYRHRVIAQLPEGDTAQQSQVREQLSGARTTEIAAFEDFVDLLAGDAASYEHVVFDTALRAHPAAHGRHRRLPPAGGADPGAGTGRKQHPLRDAAHAPARPKLHPHLLVTLPDTTPVSEAAALQTDLRRERIEPYAWVVNRSLAAAGPRDPLLRARVRVKQAQFMRVLGGLPRQRCYALPWQAEPPEGLPALEELAPRAGSQRLGAGAQALKRLPLNAEAPGSRPP